MLLFLIAALSVMQARTLCVPEAARLADIGATQAQQPCALKEWAELAHAGQYGLIRARYSAPSPDADRYELVSEVLYERRDQGPVKPLWLYQQDSSLARIESVNVVRLGKRVIVDVFCCLNGTGGCYNEMVEWNAGKGAVPFAADYRHAFDAALPKGYATYKSPSIDFKQMTISGFGWQAHDANCCPTLEMHCAISVKDNQFVLHGCRRSTVQR